MQMLWLLTFQGAIGSKGLLQLLVHLPVERPPNGGDVGLSSLLQMHLLAKLLNHEGLTHGCCICCMLLNPCLQKIDVPSLQHKQDRSEHAGSCTFLSLRDIEQVHTCNSAPCDETALPGLQQLLRNGPQKSIPQNLESRFLLLLRLLHAAE